MGSQWCARSTYTMKKLGRAKIIGARTSGGAHPVDRKPIDDDLFLQVPIGQIRDPIDHGDFESVGVQPDVEVPSIDALEVAKKLVLEELAMRSDERKSDLNWLMPSLAAGVGPPAVPAEIFQAAVGKYEGRTIGLDRGRLYVIWRERFRVGLTPVTPDLFDVEGVTECRYRLVSKAGKVVGLERVNRNGTTQMYKRL